MNASHTTESRYTLPASMRRSLAAPAYDTMTREQERAAFARLETARAAGWRACRRDRPDEDTDDVALLAALSCKPASATRSRALAEYRAAIADIERRNVRLVVSLAGRYLYHSAAKDMTLGDLTGYGCGEHGLRRAILRFEVDRGHAFSTYAAWWIRHAIGRAIADLGRPIRLPVHMQDAAAKIGRALDRLGTGWGLVSDEAIAAEAGLPLATVRRTRAAMTGVACRPRSLDAALPMADGDDVPLFAAVPDDGPTPAEQAEADDRAEYAALAVSRLLLALDEREARVVMARAGYGQPGEAPRLLAEVGADLGVGRERARQIEAQALNKMRRAAQTAGMVAAL